MISLRGLARAAALLIGIPAFALAVAACAGAGIQQIAERDSKTRFPAPGRLVDIGGGQTIHLREWGIPTDKPTLLLSVSAYAPSSAWAWIARDLAADYHVVAFDRPGMGWSSGGPLPRDARHAADALSRALDVAGIGPPYVVVAHSYGGFAGRFFAAQRRADLAAMVLLDTSHPDAPGSGHGLLARLQALRAHTGLLTLFPPPNGYASLPPGEAEAAYAASNWTSHLDASADELEAWTASADQVRAAGDFADLPLLIVAGNAPQVQRGYQLDLRSLSTRSEFVALDVGHIEMLVTPQQAALVTDEIRRFLAKR